MTEPPRTSDAFARAHQLIDAQDPEGLRAELDSHPEVVRETGGPNANNLLGMATATCDERLVELLLARGADVHQANVHGSTALHQAGSCGLPLLVTMLREAGASVEPSARGDGGTPLIHALFWGKSAAAKAIADPLVAPRNLRAAAGLGDTGLIEELVPDGKPSHEAGLHRGYYRPHSGFPEGWAPTDDPQEVLDEALAWAARNASDDTLSRLVALGAQLDSDVYRGTPLAWAASNGHVETARLLVSLGADVNGRTSFGGPDHGENATPLHLAAGDGDVTTITALLDLGADPSLIDARHEHDPAGWADHGGHAAAAELLRERSN